MEKSWTSINFSSGKNGCPFLLFLFYFFYSGKVGVLFYWCPFLLFFTPLGKIGVLFYSFFTLFFTPSFFTPLGKVDVLFYLFFTFFTLLGKVGVLFYPFLPLMGIGFLDHSSHEKNMAKLRRLYGRIRPDSVELSILRGILSETQRCLGASKNES